MTNRKLIDAGEVERHIAVIENFLETCNPTKMPGGMEANYTAAGRAITSIRSLPPATPAGLDGADAAQAAIGRSLAVEAAIERDFPSTICCSREVLIAALRPIIKGLPVPTPAGLEKAIEVVDLDSLANRLANIKQGESETPRCEPPSPYEVQIAREWAGRTLKALRDILPTAGEVEGLREAALALCDEVDKTLPENPMHSPLIPFLDAVRTAARATTQAVGLRPAEGDALDEFCEKFDAAVDEQEKDNGWDD